MKKVLLAILMILAVSALYYVASEKKISKLTIYNDQPSLIFLKDCRYDAFYIENENGQMLASLIYSETPGHGPIFREDTFIPLEKLLNVKIKRNTIYNLSGNTECLSNRQIQRKYFKFKVGDDGKIDVLNEN
ncbi:hypothetical protein [Chromobacterium amazonense]|uniref:hypothetical protein n=1 Tax=Chromobacterium amazonense TaxID=1382803 RepID=UPI0031F6718F